MDKGGEVQCVGNRTECALLLLLRSWGVEAGEARAAYSDRMERVYAFSSERKLASVLVRMESGYRLYTKARTSV